MDRKTHPVTVTIGIIEYEMSVEYGFTPAKSPTGDPRDKEDSRLIYHNILKCSAWNMETNNNYFVEDDEELEMLENWINWEEEFNAAML